MRPLVRLLAAVLAAVLLASCGGDSSSSSVTEQRPERVVVIPNGTAERASNGEWIGDIIPSRITLKAGTELVLKNEDVVALEWGPYIVGPGQTLRQVFDRPGTYRNECEFISKLQVTLVVEP